MRLPVDAAYHGEEIDLVPVRNIATTRDEVWKLAGDMHRLVHTDEHVRDLIGEQKRAGQGPEKVWETFYDPELGTVRAMQYLISSLRQPAFVHEVYGVLYHNELIGMADRRPNTVVPIEVQASGRHLALRGLHQTYINRPAGTAELHINALVDTITGLTELTRSQARRPAIGVIDTPFAVEQPPSVSTDNRLVVAYDRAGYESVAVNVLAGTGMATGNRQAYVAPR